MTCVKINLGRNIVHTSHKVEMGAKEISSGRRTRVCMHHTSTRASNHTIFNLILNSLCIRRGEYVFSCGRDSVIWDVQPLALKANISSRVTQLAEPKKLPPEHKEQR